MTGIVSDARPAAGGPAPLDAVSLYRRCDPALVPFATTAEVGGAVDSVGQARALDALAFGVRTQAFGYNLFVLGPSGSGRHEITRDFLEREAAKRPPPPDWCYLHNFEEERKPIAVRLPAGLGAELRADMARLVEELRGAIPAAFESEQYRAALGDINQEFDDRARASVEKLQQEAQARELSVLQTPQGFAIAPMRGGEVLGKEEYDRLPEEDKRRTDEAIAQLSALLREHLETLPKLQKERRDRIKALNRQVTERAAAQPIGQLEQKYRDFPTLLRYFAAVREDVLENARDFQPPEAQPPQMLGLPGMLVGAGGPRALTRYEVNVLVGHTADGHPPVVYETHPTLPNLLGRIDHLAQFGALVTDFTMIRPGALHRAYGGYLILDADRVLTEPYAWSALKRALYAREIRIESLGQLLSLVSTVSLEPEPIPLDVKVILVGERRIYYLLCALDPDFPQLFRVAADFEDRVDRSDENTAQYALLIAGMAREEGLRPLDREAVARVIEHAARLLGDSEKLTTRLRDVRDLLHEADYWAAAESSDTIRAAHVRRAVESQTRRADRVRSEIQEEIQRNTILIDTSGARVGQINGLSVRELGGFVFGHPVRITANVRLGDGKIVDIERETELGGPIHSKGVLILSSYLTARYAIDKPLSFAASLVFEQSYGGVEGDSASVAETCALLSALAELPISQSFAVTGSVNQHGQVQVIGGVNEKIEGFFDVCNRRGLTGDQGVLIPRDNVKHLMLRDDVVEAVRAGRFAIYPIAHVDEAIALLTGVPAGERDAEGNFPADTVNFRVEQKLRKLADLRQAAAERVFGAAGRAATEAAAGVREARDEREDDS
ncbi:MAG TPA: ATP-binding protein [Gammaproteobacteria bacterium]